VIDFINSPEFLTLCPAIDGDDVEPGDTIVPGETLPGPGVPSEPAEEDSPNTNIDITVVEPGSKDPPSSLPLS
jgi:hypothetical protein